MFLPWRRTPDADESDIRVSVVPEYIEEHSSPDDAQFMWHYTICITNESRDVVQLLSRVWRITDGNGRKHEVRGAGVVGETPIIMPGHSYSYTSGCPLTTPSGIMVGSFQMAAGDGELFDVSVPAFSLDSPHSMRTLN